MVGSTSAATASVSRVAIMRGVRLSKCRTPWRAPPTRTDRPSTSSALPRIEPISAVCTTVTRPAWSANTLTNSSGTLPTADCTTPVSAGPR
jgi:hypothetical protein